MSSASSWFKKLRLAPGMEEAAVVLAQAVGETVQARDCSVFLLDHTRGNLLLFASWSEDESVALKNKQAVPAWDADDPLCLALQSGGMVTVRMRPGVPLPPSLALAAPEMTHARGAVAACPLLASGDEAIGGVLLSFGKEPPFIPETNKLLCSYGALLLSFYERQSRDKSRIDSLHEDISRLEQPQRSNEAMVQSLLIGQSAAMEKVRESILQIARYSVSVLITGETGTGKDLAATAIHAAGPRRRAPFTRINCGALPSQLLESELFGHKKGAFSGAHQDYVGLLRHANGGTVLLDEIGDMPMELQVKLLRVLQDREVRPVGDVTSYPVDIRVIAATNKRLENALENGTFRKDLYYRLAHYHIHIPPLRERREDIPALVMHFFIKSVERYNSAASISHPQVMSLCARDFPGNVRELASLIENAVISMKRDEAHVNIPEGADVRSMSLYQCVESYEQALIASALACNDGNVARAARALGIPRTSLLRKMRRHTRQGAAE